MESRDLRSWMAEVENLGELKRIDGADWDVEIGAVTELGHHRGEQSKALLFDNIKGHPKGYRVLSNTLNTLKRLAATLNMQAILESCYAVNLASSPSRHSSLARSSPSGFFSRPRAWPTRSARLSGC